MVLDIDSFFCIHFIFQKCKELLYIFANFQGKVRLVVSPIQYHDIVFTFTGEVMVVIIDQFIHI
jgi:hypothetical protein